MRNLPPEPPDGKYIPAEPYDPRLAFAVIGGAITVLTLIALLVVIV